MVYRFSFLRRYTHRGSTNGRGSKGATLESVEGYEPHCRFSIEHAVDHFTVDANKSHGRIDARGALVDAEGRAVELVNTGLVRINEATLPLIQQQPDAKTAPFGHGLEVVHFRTGCDEYKDLENRIFVSSMRFTYIDGERTGIEQRISEVVSGTGME
ncbi:hypothetical protein SLS62_001002 [Diatrype stigma]|uniref:Uncharacterized protein n=1 Tax=Diatrype stigma TaxID=117547 RepID=A0AAN9UZZ0_9PEZI